MRGDLRPDSYVLLLASCSACVYECMNRCGVGVNAQMRPEEFSPSVMPFKSLLSVVDRLAVLSH